jgi:hypothetical protein
MHKQHHYRDLTFVRQRAAYQSTLFGDTYLTPQEALVYINQMLATLKRYKEKTSE